MLTRGSVLLAAACLGGALILPATASAQTAKRYTDGAAAPTATPPSRKMARRCKRAEVSLRRRFERVESVGIIGQ